MPMQSMYCIMVVTGLGGLMYAHQQSWGAHFALRLAGPFLNGCAAVAFM